MSYTEAFALLSKFYTEKHANASDSFNQGKLHPRYIGCTFSERICTGDLMAAITDFSKLVVIALAQSLKYLATFNVADALRETRFFGKFTERTHMLLNANTLTNLYANPLASALRRANSSWVQGDLPERHRLLHEGLANVGPRPDFYQVRGSPPPELGWKAPR